MMDYKDIVNKQHYARVFLCTLKSGNNARMIVDFTDDGQDLALYNFDDHNDETEYLESDIETVVEEISFEDELVTESITKDALALTQYAIDNNTYRFDSLSQLLEIIKGLDNPVINNYHNTLDQNTKLSVDYGIVYSWDHHDDFDDYPVPFCAIIFGVKPV